MINNCWTEQPLSAVAVSVCVCKWQVVGVHLTLAQLPSDEEKIDWSGHRASLNCPLERQTNAETLIKCRLIRNVTQRCNIAQLTIIAQRTSRLFLLATHFSIIARSWNSVSSTLRHRFTNPSGFRSTVNFIGGKCVFVAVDPTSFGIDH